ncbi:MAG TPA: phosphocholine cytidylyltransferase family protein [bacterium]
MERAQRTDCLIIAAGKGSRLAALGEPKPLVTLAGMTLLERVMLTVAAAGIRSFRVVTGYLGEAIERFVPASPLLAGLDVRFVRNDEWEKANGVSVARAASSLGDRFVLLMSDHLFDPRILARLLAEPIAADEVILAVDSRIEGHPTVDLEDVTKVRVEAGAIREIGKGIATYNAFDTGIFLCTPALFAALEESFRAGDFSLSGGIGRLAARGKARVFDVGDGLWIDVDDVPAYERARALVASGALASGAGPRPGA